MPKNPFKRDGLFGGASHLVFELAKKNRNNMTDAETFLWQYLKGGVNGYKFRRQHPIGIYIADFYCHKFKLIIELDGSIHNQREVQLNDKQRQDDLESLGYTIVRFTNKQVMNDVNTIIKEIESTIKKLSANNY